MRKTIAILNVFAWAGFWAFGYIALGVDHLSDTQMAIAAALAFGGLITGLLAYFKLVRMAEETGYTRASNRLTPQERERAQAQWEDK
jgi:hypothetical protein